MDKVKSYLKDTYHLTGYQAACVIFLFKSIFSEVSKTLIMALLFHQLLPEYFFALFIMLFLRCSTGGIHFYTYWGCLLMSISYMALSIVILPMIQLPLPIQLLMLMFSMLVCFGIGPVVSKYRKETTGDRKMYFRSIASGFILVYTLTLMFFPEAELLHVGFWVIITHSLQLIVAKIRKKGGQGNDRMDC